jgi:hypothetical protein
LDAFTSSGNYLGTDRIGRALTDAEKKQLARLLRANDFVGASMVALRFAYRLARRIEGARDLMGRTNLRLVRWGWDPNAVPLAKRLCRLVWSEFTHQKRETAAARRAEEVFLREQQAEGAGLVHAAPTRGDPLRQSKEPAAPSAEQQAIRLEDEREQDARDEKELARLRQALPKLRERLQAHEDDVNLMWLDYRLKGIKDPGTMARESGRNVTEFYAAAKRRERAVRAVLPEVTGEPAVDEENE